MLGITRLEIKYLQDVKSEPITIYITGMYIDNNRIQYYHPITGEYEIIETR